MFLKDGDPGSATNRLGTLGPIWVKPNGTSCDAARMAISPAQYRAARALLAMTKAALRESA